MVLLQQVQHFSMIKPLSLPEPRVLFLLVLLSSWYHGKITKQEAYNLLMTGIVPLFLCHHPAFIWSEMRCEHLNSAAVCRLNLTLSL